MKILFVQTNYAGFLNSFYSLNPKAKSLTYSDLQKAWAKELFGSSDFYSTNIKRYGWQAKEVVANDWIMQSKWAKDHHIMNVGNDNRIVSTLPESLKNLLGLRGWVKTILFAQIKAIRPDVVYLFNLSLLNSFDVKQLKKLTKLVVGQIAAPLPIDRRPLRNFNLITTSFPHYARNFRKLGIRSEYLPWCFEQDVLKVFGKTARTLDVVYVGGLTISHSKGNRTLEKLSRMVNVDIWGYGERSLPFTSPILRNFHGQAWGKQMYQIFAKSKIVVNRHIDVAGNYANNMRMFEATGMGALLITDYKKNLSDFFEIDKEVVAYKNPDDLVRKVRYYLKNPKKARKIALAGQRRTLRDHTYKVRMRQLDKILRKYLNEM